MREAGVGIGLWVQILGGLRYAYQGGGLDKREVDRRNLEIVLRRRFDAVASVAVVDRVEVHHEDLVFGIAILHLNSKLDLARFALEGDVGCFLGEHGVSHQLLRNGGSAFQTATGKIVNHRAGDAHEIGAVVFVETHVFGVHRAVDDVLAYLLDSHRLALFELEAR